MRILLISTGLGIGGAERQVLDLASSFQKKGHCVKVVYLKGEISIPNINHSLDIQKADFDAGILHGFTALIKIIKSFNSDVVHSHMVHANLITRVSRIFTNIPRLISTAHNTNEGGMIRMLAYRLTDSLADISTNVSVEAVEAFEKKKAVPKGRMLAIHNGIDIRNFDFKKEIALKYRNDFKFKFDEKIFIAVGRLVKAKDYPNLISAFSEITKKYKCKLLIVGDGILKNDLMQRCINNGLHEKVLFLGARNDVNALMNAADYFVLSSAWEGFGLVVAEAMATEKIVIATDCGGVAEVVGDAGFLVPAKSPTLLAEAMEKALQLDAEAAQIMRKKARNRIVSKYSLDSIALKWLDLYEKL